jgi:hypothetical protein
MITLNGRYSLNGTLSMSCKTNEEKELNESVSLQFETRRIDNQSAQVEIKEALKKHNYNII